MGEGARVTGVGGRISVWELRKLVTDSADGCTAVGTKYQTPQNDLNNSSSLLLPVYFSTEQKRAEQSCYEVWPCGSAVHRQSEMSWDTSDCSGTQCWEGHGFLWAGYNHRCDTEQ